jgi:hypothetical protein
MLGSNQVDLNAMMAFEIQRDLILAQGALQSFVVNKLY